MSYSIFVPLQKEEHLKLLKRNEQVSKVSCITARDFEMFSYSRLDKKTRLGGTGEIV